MVWGEKSESGVRDLEGEWRDAALRRGVLIEGVASEFVSRSTVCEDMVFKVV